MEFQTIPTDYARLYDTNRVYYKLYTSNYTLPDFRYYINLYVSEWVGTGYTFNSVATVRKRPLADGTCIFYPAEILQNYIEGNIDISSTGLTSSPDSTIVFRIGVSEQYTTNRATIRSAETLSQSTIGYNGVQEYLPYDTIGGNNLWVMNTGTTLQGTGYYLTDMMYAFVDSTEHKWLYFLKPTGATPTAAIYSIYYGEQPITPSGDLTNYSQSAPGSLSSNIGKTPFDYEDLYWTGDVEQKVLTFDFNHPTYQWSIPAGPSQLTELGYFNTGKTWSKYRIDIVSGAYKHNLFSTVFYRKNKCYSKFRRYELVWRNPHGGYDTHLFYLKNNLKYTIERMLFEKRLSPNYNIGDRGTTQYSTKVKETITLNSDWITQNEYQLLTQLIMSPEVYMFYNYLSSSYIVPMVIVDTDIDYKYVDQDKLVGMTIQLTPSFTKNIK